MCTARHSLQFCLLPVIHFSAHSPSKVWTSNFVPVAQPGLFPLEKRTWSFWDSCDLDESHLIKALKRSAPPWFIGHLNEVPRESWETFLGLAFWWHCLGCSIFTSLAFLWVSFGICAPRAGRVTAECLWCHSQGAAELGNVFFLVKVIKICSQKPVPACAALCGWAQSWTGDFCRNDSLQCW